MNPPSLFTPQSQAVADLLWVVNSPSFVTGDAVAPSMNLDPTAIDEALLARFLDERMSGRSRHRVGHYFEHLLAYWLEHVRRVELLGTGVQVRDGKRTIGEVDFLYCDERGVVVHCEASVKFFLHHPRPDASHYPGPNSTDDYERKVAKLFDQQLPLSLKHFPEVQQRHAFVKGMVFYHGAIGVPSERPDRMPAEHLRGRWYRASEIDQLRSRTDVACTLADKPHWLAPSPSARLEPPSEFCDGLKSHFRNRAHPVMVSVRSGATEEEVERAFVVPDHWPDRADLS